MPTQVENDVPLGAFGRLVGLRVVPPELLAGEEVRWSVRANRRQNKLRAVGGRLYLTNRRLIFGRSKLESHLGGKEWSAPLGDLNSAAMSGRRTMRVEVDKGKAERFLVPNGDQSTAVVESAIREADSVAPAKS